jgi:hypothetical protein
MGNSNQKLRRHTNTYSTLQKANGSLHRSHKRPMLPALKLLKRVNRMLSQPVQTTPYRRTTIPYLAMTTMGRIITSHLMIMEPMVVMALPLLFSNLFLLASHMAVVILGYKLRLDQSSRFIRHKEERLRRSTKQSRSRSQSPNRLQFCKTAGMLNGKDFLRTIRIKTSH